METLFLSRLAITLACSLFCNLLVGQNSYFVFKRAGNPYFNKMRLVERGSLFNASDTLYLNQKDSILLVGKKGVLYELNEPNRYLITDIASHKKDLNTDSFTKKYFTYVWKQFTNQYKKKQEAGVVYREDRDVELLEPMDSVKLHAPEIRFSWNNKTDTEEVYFILKDFESGHLTKIGVSGNSLLLYLDNQLLQPGKKYGWAVSTTSFPNLNEMQFNHLNLLTKESYDNIKKDLTTLFAALRLMGFTDKQIQQLVCLDYKFCM